MRTFILMFISALLLISPASAFDIVREDREAWVCVDYSVTYARNNPDWGIVTISHNPMFSGLSHMVNYQIIDNETIAIHDEALNAEYQVHNWQLDGQYYHFWFDEQNIKRNYKRLFDNRERVT